MWQAVLVALAFLGMDFLAGVGISIAKGTFNIQKLPDFLRTSIPWQWIVTTVATGVGQIVLSGNQLDSKVVAGVFVAELGAISVKLAQDIIQKFTGTAPVTATLKP